MTWPLRAARISARFTQRFGSRVAAETGKSRARQVAEQLWLAAVDGTPASFYYRHEIYREPIRSRRRFLAPARAVRLFESLNREPSAAVDDKLLFHELCVAHGMPTPVVAGVVRNGVLEMRNAEPPVALFVKPVAGSRGEGTCAWHYGGQPGCYKRDDGRVEDWPAIVSRLERESRVRPYLVQELLTSAAEMADLSSGPLATVRIITGMEPSGRVECIAAVYRMPSSVSRDGLFAPVALGSGELGRADSCRPLCAGFDRHPDTSGPITGRVLPFWPQTVDLVARAHVLFPGYVFLGWDVALTGSGPMLLETNAGWDVVSIERPHRRPLMDTRFANIRALWESA